MKTLQNTAKHCKTLLIVFLAFCSTNIFGQKEKVIKLKLEKIKAERSNIDKQHKIFSSLTAYHNLDNQFFKNTKNLNSFQLEVETPYGIFNISLSKVIKPNSGAIFTKDSIKTVPLDYFEIYRGEETGNKKHTVSLIIYDDNQIDGTINLEGESIGLNYYKDESSSWTNIYKTSEDDSKEECNTKSISQSQISTKNLKVSAGCDFLSVALEGDYEFYQQFGTNAFSKMLGRLNDAEAAYRAAGFDIYFRSSSVSYWSVVNDPYPTTNDMPTFLNNFRNYWNTNRGYIPRDLGVIFSGRTFTGGIGGRAFEGSACNAIDSYISISYLSNQTDAWRAKVLIHEMGHFLGASHSTTGCTNAGFPNSDPVMCPIVNAGPINFGTTTITQINNKLNTISCFKTPNIYPTFNNVLYSGQVTNCGTSTLSLNNSSGSLYQWYVSPSFLSPNGTFSANGNSATVSNTGFYILVGKIIDACGYYSANNFYLNPCGTAAVKVFPNSVTNYIDIEGLSSLNSKNIILFDSRGTQTKVGLSINEVKQGTYRVIFEEQLKGNYYLNVISEMPNVKTFRLIFE